MPFPISDIGFPISDFPDGGGPFSAFIRAKNYYDLRKAAVIISTRDHAEDHAPSCTLVMSLTVDLHSNNLNSGERSSLNSGESE